jgi:hypothetical protein
MPRRLTPLGEGLATYLGPDSGPGRVAIDEAPARPAISALRANP